MTRSTDNRVPLLIVLAAVPLLWGFDPFRSSNSDVEQGNAKLGANKAEEALEHYDRAAKELPDAPGVHYNRGVALARMGKRKEAREALNRAATAREHGLKSKAFYNLGNVLYQLKKYKEAAGAYKRSLRLRPNHRPSKWNLELALRRIKREQKKKRQQKDKKTGDKQRKKQQDRPDQDRQRGDKNPRPRDRGDKQQPRDQRPRDQKKRQQPSDQRKRPRPTPSRKRRDAVLDALDRSDRSLQRRRARMKYRGGLRQPAKDW